VLDVKIRCKPFRLFAPGEQVALALDRTL